MIIFSQLVNCDSDRLLKIICSYAHEQSGL